MTVKLSMVIEDVQQVLINPAVSPDSLGEESRAYYNMIQNKRTPSHAAQAAIAAGAVDDRSSTQRLFDLENVMTDSRCNPGAYRAYNAMYQLWGLSGVQALYNAGYNNPGDLWDFYLKCNKCAAEMANQLGLNR